MPEYVVSRLEFLLDKPLNGLEVLVAGLAYKPGVSDIRESPALEIISKLRQKGANTVWYDPLVTHWENGPSSV